MEVATVDYSLQRTSSNEKFQSILFWDADQRKNKLGRTLKPLELPGGADSTSEKGKTSVIEVRVWY
ncbi:MAG: hypothetical protein ACUVTL_07960 [Thermoproteota archaeon]